MEGMPKDEVPQFATAEYAQPGAALCKSCGKSISGDFYRVNGVPVCGSCAQRIRDQMPVDSHSAFVRGIFCGVGGAILGLALYVGFALATGWIVGFVSLAVGYIVGKAVVFGSGGVGGRRYQVAAVLLTYIAVSMAALPIAISHHMKQNSSQQAQSKQSRDRSSAEGAPAQSARCARRAWAGVAVSRSRRSRARCHRAGHFVRWHSDCVEAHREPHAEHRRSGQ